MKLHHVASLLEPGAKVRGAMVVLLTSQ
jgi:hypothetical protein